MLIKEKNVLIVSIDHGFCSIKGPHFVMENGVTRIPTEPAFKENTIFYKGRASIYQWRKRYLNEGTLGLMNNKNITPGKLKEGTTDNTVASSEEITQLKSQMHDMQLEIDILKETKLMESNGLIRSMSPKGSSPDNSACEGVFGRLKNEMFYNTDWTGVNISEFIDILNNYLYWYNEKRIKKSLGYLSPMEYRRSLGIAV